MTTDIGYCHSAPAKKMIDDSVYGIHDFTFVVFRDSIHAICRWCCETRVI